MQSVGFGKMGQASREVEVEVKVEVVKLLVGRSIQRTAGRFRDWFRCVSSCGYGGLGAVLYCR